MVRYPPNFCTSVKSVIRVSQHVRDLNGLAFEQGAAHRRAAVRLHRQGPEVLDELGRVPVSLGANEPSLLLAGDGGGIGVTELGGRFDQSLQH